MDLTTKYFLLGAVGTMAPEVVRLFTIARDKQRFTWSPFYIIMSLLIAGLGGLVTILLDPANARTAFFTGISTPLLITAAAKKIISKPKKKGPSEERLSRFDSFFHGL